jgi:hypothetical protein
MRLSDETLHERTVISANGKAIGSISSGARSGTSEHRGGSCPGAISSGYRS